MISCGPTSGRVYRRGSDPLGRFTWMALRGRDGTGVIVITLYRVCQNSGTTAGPNTAYMKEWEALRERGNKHPDPREAVLRDASDVLHEWGNRGYHPLIMMDANADIDESRLESFIKQHGLIDLVADTNNGKPPRTYVRGVRKIDFAFGDSHVRKAVVKAGSLGLHDGVSLSDHTMQFIDLDCKILFGIDTNTPYATYEREFKLKDAKKKAAFIEKLTAIYKHQKIPERVQQLALQLSKQGPTPELVQKYQAIDYETTCAIKSAANAVGRKNFGHQRSDVLVNAGRKVRLMKSISSCIRNSTGKYSEKVVELAKQLDYDLEPYDTMTIRKARRKVTAAILEKKEVNKNAAEHRAKWLERMAQEIASQKPGSDWEKVLKQMVKAA